MPGGDTDIYINPANFASVYAGGLSQAQVAIASVVQRPITASALADPAEVGPPAATPKWEIVAVHDNAIPTKAEFFMADRCRRNGPGALPRAVAGADCCRRPARVPGYAPWNARAEAGVPSGLLRAGIRSMTMRCQPPSRS